MTLDPATAAEIIAAGQDATALALIALAIVRDPLLADAIDRRYFARACRGEQAR